MAPPSPNSDRHHTRDRRREIQSGTARTSRTSPEKKTARPARRFDFSWQCKLKKKLLKSYFARGKRPNKRPEQQRARSASPVVRNHSGWRRPFSHGFGPPSWKGRCGPNVRRTGRSGGLTVLFALPGKTPRQQPVELIEHRIANPPRHGLRHADDWNWTATNEGLRRLRWRDDQRTA